MLNILEDALICLNKEFWICQNSECVWCSTYHKVAAYSEHYQTCKMECFAKTIVFEWRRTTWTFQGRGDFVELGHFDKHFVKNTSKKLHKYILNGKFNSKMDAIRAFFPQIWAFFRFSKKGRGGLALSPLVARLWVWINMDQYLWISLNSLQNTCIMFWLCQGF